MSLRSSKKSRLARWSWSSFRKLNTFRMWSTKDSRTLTLLKV